MSVFSDDLISSPIPSIQLCRTFHPVGQGAFYSEVFTDSLNHNFIMVYDCGTETYPRDFKAAGGRMLAEQVKDFADSRNEDNRHIDVLFISHLHGDHINGVRHLMQELPPKLIVLPMLPLNVILACRIANFVKYGVNAIESDELILDLYFGRRQDVVGVRPISLGNEELYPSNRSIGNGEVVEKIPFWRYRSFNSIDAMDPRIDVLIKKILAIPDVFVNYRLDVGKAIEHLDELKNAYKDAMRNINDNFYTLVVESEPVDGVIEKDMDYLAHCVSFGDFVPHNDVWTRFLANINDYDQVGTIQVPHHGAKLNWRKEMCTDNTKICVISSGSTNKYHHPNYWVVEDIALAGVEIKVASERPGSMVQQCIRVR